MQHDPVDSAASTGNESSYTLKELAVGDSAVIAGYRATHRGYRSKLLSMGLTRGTPLVVRNRAPLGDPVVIGVRDFELTLRADEAEGLLLNEVTRTQGQGRRRRRRHGRRHDRQAEETGRN